MNFNEIYQAAMDVINYTAASRNGIMEAGATVCVLASVTGRVYNGVSHQNVHAEIEAVRNMQAYGENAITTIILVDANTRLALLPCINCLNYILTLNPVNYNAFVAMPDRPVPFSEVLQNNNSVSVQLNSGQVSMNTRSAQVSSMVISGRAKGGVLKGKVTGMMKAATELESDEDLDLIEELEEAAREKKEGRKGLFGLFGKK
jgi:deoxycytidylate deaminase